MSDSISYFKSRRFAIRIVKLSEYLNEEQKAYTLSKQILRSGTSIGANLAEAQYAISKDDFLAKQYIAMKECSETRFWLELLHEVDYISSALYKSLDQDCVEILRLLTASTKTLRSKR